MEKFKSDLNQGEMGERVIANFILLKRPIKKIEFMGKGKDWDFRCEDINGKVITFEVKTDRYEHIKGITTGNMFIEISCNKIPSGINASKADYFVYYYPDLEIFYLMPLPEFRLFLRVGNGFHDVSTILHEFDRICHAVNECPAHIFLM